MTSSDSDEDQVSRIETSVLLGIPDGPVESSSDLKDAAVSRIGGVPVRLYTRNMYFHFNNICDFYSQALLSHKVPFDSSHCHHCKSPMELLVQLWAPLEDSPYDRSVYVWGCAKSGCQRKSGRYVSHMDILVSAKKTDGIWYSVRAWRGLRYNEDYASKLKRKLSLKREHEQVQSTQYEGPDPPHQNVNPFSVRCD
jgi:pre-rRNA-processing protein TSR4